MTFPNLSTYVAYEPDSMVFIPKYKFEFLFDILASLDCPPILGPLGAVPLSDNRSTAPIPTYAI